MSLESVTAPAAAQPSTTASSSSPVAGTSASPSAAPAVAVGDQSPLLTAVCTAVQEEIHAVLGRTSHGPASAGPPRGLAVDQVGTSTTMNAGASAALGTLPAAAAIADMPTIDPMASESGALTSTLATLPALLTAGGSSASASSADSNPGKAVVLSSALPRITAKLAAKIMSGQFVAMKELLADNMTLCQQLEAFPTNQHIFTGTAKPRLREIDSPLTWVSCFLAYVAVITNDSRTRNLLTYGRLVVREAQRHSGPGWIEYDRIFRQHAALSPSTVWHELNPSLHASTVLSYRAGPGKVCGLCHEPDHVAEACAMHVLQPQPSSMSTAQSYPLGGHSTQSVAGPIRRPARQETLERICISWNRGRCSFPWCKFRHVCATCKQRGHRAKECQQTPPDSAYKALAGSFSKTATTSSSSQV